MRPLTQPRTSPHPPAVMALSPTARFPLSSGDRGTAQTIEKIRHLVHQGMTDQLVNRTAIGIVQGAGVQQFDFAGEVRAIYEWVRRSIRFTRDIAGVETLRTAREILTVRAGDCDDINGILLPSLLGSIGHDVRLVTISSDPSEPQTFSHIYCEVEIGAQWIPLDSARHDPGFGKGPRSWFRKRIWSLTDNSYRDVKGLGFYAGRPRRMGDFTDIATGIANIVGSAGAASSSIINSLTPRIGQSFAVNPATGQLVPVSPTGQLVVGSVPGGVAVATGGTIPTWLMYGGLAFGAIFLLAMVKK